MRWFLAGLPLQSAGYGWSVVHDEFVVEEVAMRQIFDRVFRSLSVSVIRAVYRTRRSYHRRSTVLETMYLSITNKMQSYTMIFITINVLHASGGSSAHHQELKTVSTTSGICRAFTASYRLREPAVRSTKSSTNTWCCVYSFELLMMGGGTAWNM